MNPTFEAVSRFALKHGRVEVWDTQGNTRKVGADSDSIDLVEKADKFLWNDVWYDRQEFCKLLQEKLSD